MTDPGMACAAIRNTKPSLLGLVVVLEIAAARIGMGVVPEVRRRHALFVLAIAGRSAPGHAQRHQHHQGHQQHAQQATIEAKQVLNLRATEPAKESQPPGKIPIAVSVGM